MSPRNRIAFFIFSLFRAFIRAIPVRLAIPFGRALAIAIGRLLPRERRISEAQIRFAAARAEGWAHQAFGTEKAPDRAAFDHPSALIDSMMGHAGESVVELFSIQKWLERDPSKPSGFRYIDSTGQEHVQALRDQHIGAVTLSGHIGCFELLAAFHVTWGADVSVIGRDPNYPLLSSILRELRRDYGVETIWRNENSAPKKLISALRTGRVVAALIDQDTALENSFAPFFGLDAASPSGPIRLAIKQRLPILTSFIVRTSRLHHHVITRRIDYDPDDPGAPTSILAEFNRHLEALIVRYPDQWLWWHRRWRRRPEVDYSERPLELRGTEEYIQWLTACNGKGNR